MRLFLVLIGLASSINACGLITHVDVTLRAINHFTPSVPGDYDYDKVIKENRDYLMAGSVFPDWGYVCNTMGGEVAHWEPFLKAFYEYITSTYTKGTKKYDQMVAFYFGVTSHVYSDIMWHYGNRIHHVTDY